MKKKHRVLDLFNRRRRMAKEKDTEKELSGKQENTDESMENASGTEQAAPAADKGEDLTKKIAELENKVAEAEAKRLLLLADMENLRKRCSKDIESARYNTLTDTVTPFLKVFDYFTMAVKASETTDNLESMVTGMKMIQQEFDRAFSDLGVQPINAVGADFDPNLHEAVSQEASDTVPAGKVIRQWSPGYKYGSRLLKAAPVIVSSGPAAVEEKKEEPEKREEEGKEA